MELDLEHLAYWFRENKGNLRKNLLYCWCVNVDNIENLKIKGFIKDENLARDGFYLSRLLRKLVDPDKEDEKQLKIARYKALKEIEETVNKIVELNTDFFSKIDKNYEDIYCVSKDRYALNNYRDYLINAIFSFYLSRYNFIQAFQFALKFKKSLLWQILMPRLLGSLFASTILIITSAEIWNFIEGIKNLYSTIPLLLGIVFIFFYVVVLDMRNIVPTLRIKSKIRRFFLFLIISGIESTTLAYTVILLQKQTNFISNKININMDWLDIALMSISILLIGIIMNIFWQKETIPKPL